jgi:hypothetical protein
MLTTFSFEFGHRFVPVRGWAIAFLIYSEDNVYTPDPEALRVTAHPEGILIEADAFAWAGLQQRGPGLFRAECSYVEGGFDVLIKASLPERIKGTAVLVRDAFPGQVPTRDYAAEPCPRGGAVLTYPRPMPLPVFPLTRADGSFTAIGSLDEEVRGKAVAVVPQDAGALLELHHYEDARRWSTEQSTPAWRITHCKDPEALFDARAEIAGRCWGLRDWGSRDDVPEWARQIGLVLNLHGTHWSGHVFNTYAQQLDAIRYAADRLGGRHILALLAAWDGRYNYNWPRYEPDLCTGGEQGLRNLVATRA